MNDWQVLKETAHASDQLLAAVRQSAPHWRIRLSEVSTFHDVRGMIDAAPGLVVVFTTRVGLKGAVQVAPAPGISHFLMLPQLFRNSWNMKIVETQVLVQHELAHIVMGHREIAHLARPGTPAYYNLDEEIDAYLQTALAAIPVYERSQFSWTSGPATVAELLGTEEDVFVDRVMRQFRQSATKAFTPENVERIRARIADVHREATADFAIAEAPDLSM